MPCTPLTISFLYCVAESHQSLHYLPSPFVSPLLYICLSFSMSCSTASLFNLSARSASDLSFSLFLYMKQVSESYEGYDKIFTGGSKQGICVAAVSHDHIEVCFDVLYKLPTGRVSYFARDFNRADWSQIKLFPQYKFVGEYTRLACQSTYSPILFI
jgi:hypothetical protein